MRFADVRKVRVPNASSIANSCIGLRGYQGILATLKVAGWSPSQCIPRGGHRTSLGIAAGLGLGGNENDPDLLQPYGGFPGRVRDSRITMPELRGIGFEGKSDVRRAMRAAAE